MIGRQYSDFPQVRSAKMLRRLKAVSGPAHWPG